MPGAIGANTERGHIVFYRTSKALMQRDPSLRILARDDFINRRKLIL
jgi:hypothetical protein